MNVNTAQVAQAKLEALIEAASELSRYARQYGQYHLDKFYDGKLGVNAGVKMLWDCADTVDAAIAEARKSPALAAPEDEGGVVRAAEVEDIIASGKRLQREFGQANPTWSLMRKLLTNYQPHGAGLLARPVDRERLANVASKAFHGTGNWLSVADAILREVGR